MLKNDPKIDELAYKYYLEYISNSHYDVFYRKSCFVEEKVKFKEFYNQANKSLRKDKINKINKSV